MAKANSREAYSKQLYKNKEQLKLLDERGEIEKIVRRTVQHRRSFPLFLTFDFPFSALALRSTADLL